MKDLVICLVFVYFIVIVGGLDIRFVIFGFVK